MAAKFVISKGSGGEYRFNLKEGNGEIILTSETYVDKAGAQNGIESVKANAADDSQYERRTATNGQPYFVLKGANGEIIGRSETYSSNSAMEGGIESVKRNAPAASVEDD